MSEIIKKGEYPEKNRLKCKECGCEFEFYNTEITIETTDELDFSVGGYGVSYFINCPQCGTKCIISSNFIEYESVFSRIKKWFTMRKRGIKNEIK